MKSKVLSIFCIIFLTSALFLSLFTIGFRSRLVKTQGTVTAYEAVYSDEGGNTLSQKNLPAVSYEANGKLYSDNIDKEGISVGEKVTVFYPKDNVKFILMPPSMLPIIIVLFILSLPLLKCRIISLKSSKIPSVIALTSIVLLTVMGFFCGRGAIEMTALNTPEPLILESLATLILFIIMIVSLNISAKQINKN